MLAPTNHKIQEMASEYRFDYKKAKPNRFAQKMNLNVGWTVERFVEEEKPKKKAESGKNKAAPAKAKKVTKAKPAAKTKSLKGKTRASPAKKAVTTKKPATKPKSKKKK